MTDKETLMSKWRRQLCGNDLFGEIAKPVAPQLTDVERQMVESTARAAKVLYDSLENARATITRQAGEITKLKAVIVARERRIKDLSAILRRKTRA